MEKLSKGQHVKFDIWGIGLEGEFISLADDIILIKTSDAYIAKFGKETSAHVDFLVS